PRHYNLPLLLRRLAERLDDLAAEGGDVVGPARGDEVTVHHHLLVNPLGARIDHIVLDREEGGGLLALDDARAGEHPARVADGCYHLALLGGLAHQLHHALVAAHHVGRIAAGHDHRVELDGTDLISVRVDVDG